MSASTLSSRLQADLTAAMKARDQVTVATIRMVRTAITNAEVAGDTAIQLDDEQVLAVLVAEAKQRTEAAEVYAEAGRAESAAKERAELEVIQRYLPTALSDAELDGLIDAAIAEATVAGVAGPKALGQVIKAVRDRAGAAADGARIAAAVRAKLV